MVDSVVILPFLHYYVLSFIIIIMFHFIFAINVKIYEI